MKQAFKIEKEQAAYEALVKAARAAARCEDVVIDMVCADIVRLEGLKEMYRLDIESRGVAREVHNGRQRYIKENVSCTALMKAIETQRKLMITLGLADDGQYQPNKNDDGFDDI
jgi:hypothetical protein